MARRNLLPENYNHTPPANPRLVTTSRSQDGFDPLLPGIDAHRLRMPSVCRNFFHSPQDSREVLFTTVRQFV